MMRTLRLIVGLAFVAAGVSLAAPAARRLADAASLHVPATGGTLATPGMVSDHAAGLGDGASVTPPNAAAAGGLTVAASSPGITLPPAEPHSPPAPPAAFVHQAAPPVPPPWSIGWEPAPPLGQTYRSALETPPPPLLDEAGPARRVTAVSTNLGPAAPREPVGASPEVATYRVRDGDDLAGIASRFYGHPHAAAAIYAANQDIIRDPALLPIGLEIRMPPRWSFESVGGAAIEPRSAFGTR